MDKSQGRMASHKKEQHKQQKADVAAVEVLNKEKNKKKHKDSADAIREVKGMICQERCYGKKLNRALLESKALEERDEVMFKKELREKENEHTKTNTYCTLALDKGTVGEQKHRRSTAIQIVLENKEMYEKQVADAIMAKKEAEQAGIKNMQLMKELLDSEAQAEEEVRISQKEALQEHEENQNKIKQERAKRAAENDAKIEIRQQEKEELNCKIKPIAKKKIDLQKIQKETSDYPQNTKVYNSLKQCHEEDRKRVENLDQINNDVQAYRFAKFDREVLEKKKQDHENAVSIVAANKATVKTHKAIVEREKQNEFKNKYFYDRLSLPLQSHMSGQQEVENETNEQRPSYFHSSNTLSDKLKKRIQESSPWSGTQAKHDDFARHADETLREYKYKNAGRKVVDIQTEATDYPQHTKVYNTLKQCHEEDRKRVEILEQINNDVQAYRFAKFDREVLEKKKQDHENAVSIVAANKATVKIHKAIVEREKQNEFKNKYFYDRLSLPLQSHTSGQQEVENGTNEQRPSCFHTSNTMSSELKKRMQESSPWSGTQAKNDENSRHADETLRDCKYKNAGRKAVDEK